MTLILTRASKDYVLQVADRLVTEPGGKPFDGISNKNVLYCARNGFVTLGYTGFAYLGDIPTDQWIVETLTGQTFDRDRKPPAFQRGPIEVRDIGYSLTLLKEGLEKAPVEPKRLRDWKRSSFDVCVAGWQWSKKRSRPVIGWLSKDENTLEIELGYTPRHWHFDRHLERKAFKIKVAAIPASNFPRPQLNAMTAKLENCGPDQAEEIMVETIREVSLSVPQVGPDCMSVLLAPSTVIGVRVRYIPRRSPARAVVSTSHDMTLSVPAAFTPWIVGTGVIWAPSINAGNFRIQIGCNAIALDAPELSGGGIQGLFSSQERPKLP